MSFSDHQEAIRSEEPSWTPLDGVINRITELVEPIVSRDGQCVEHAFASELGSVVIKREIDNSSIGRTVVSLTKRHGCRLSRHDTLVFDDGNIEGGEWLSGFTQKRSRSGRRVNGRLDDTSMAVGELTMDVVGEISVKIASILP